MKTINFEKYNLNNDKIFSAMGEMFNARIESAEGVYGCDLHNHLLTKNRHLSMAVMRKKLVTV